MATIKLRRGTAAEWASANPVLALGEPGVETDTGTLRIGDGSTAFVDLAGHLDETALAASIEAQLGDVAGAAVADAIAADPNLGVVSKRGRFPVISIDLVGAADPTSKEDYLSGTYAITDTDGGAIHSGGIRLRGRGNSTWGRDKKPWRINLDAATALLGMTAKQKNWALLANDFDPSKINNSFALELGARMSGLAWTPQYRIVELVLNGTYRGLYQLADLVRMETGRVAGSEPDDDGDGSDGTWLLEITNKESPTNAPIHTGEPAGLGFYTPVYENWIAYDTPEEPAPAQEDYIADAIGAFETALLAGDWAGWKQLADANSFADWWLINELIRNGDSHFWSSCKIHKLPDIDGTPGKIIMGPLWDQDHSMSNTWQPGVDSSPVGWQTRDADWISRMWQDAEWRTLVQARWVDLTAAIADMGGVDAWVDRSLDGLDRAISRDDQRWTRSTYTVLEADKRKRWLSTRITWLDGQINAPLD